MTKPIRNGLVQLIPTPELLPVDHPNANPTREIVDGFSKAGPPRLGGIPAPIGAAKSVATSIDPLQVLRSIDEAVVELRVPGTPGTYGHDIGSFTIHPGTMMTVKAMVRNGRIVPEESRLDFTPAIDGPLWVTAQQVKVVPKENDEFGLELVLGGFPDIDISTRVLGMASMPNDLWSLFAILSSTLGQVESNVDGLLRGMPFDPGAFDISVTNIRMREGPIPLGSEHAALTLLPGSKISATGNADGLRIAGDFNVKGFKAKAGENEVDLGQFTSRGTIFTQIDKQTLKPLQTTVDFFDVNTHLRAATLVDDNGSRMRFGETQLQNARVALTTNLQDLTAAPVLHLATGKIDARLDEAVLSIEQEGQRFPLELASGRFKGEVTFYDGRLTAQINQSGIQASSPGMKLGQGQLELGYSEVEISGSGLCDYQDGVARFAGLLEIDGTLDQGRLGQPNGPLYVRFAKGTAVRLDVTQAYLGGEMRAFSGKGAFTAMLDGGKVLLPQVGARLDIGAGSSAKIECTAIHVANDRVFAQGSVELDALVGTTVAPAAVSNDSVIITQAGTAKGRAQISLKDVTYDGESLSIGSEIANIEATVSSITGRLRPAPLRLAPTVKPKPAEVEAAAKSLALTPPSIDALANAVIDGNVDIRIPVPPGSYGVWPIRFKVPKSPETTARFQMQVKDGKIDRANVRLVFEPAIDGPLWIASRGFRVNEDGHFIADLKGFPDIDVSALVFGSVKLPEAFEELPGWAARLQSTFNSTVGRIVSLPKSNTSFESLASSNIKMKVTDVRLEQEKLSLGGDSFVTPGPSGRYNMTFESGVATLYGRGDLLEARVRDELADIDGLSGQADLHLSVRGQGKSLHIDGSLKNFEGEVRCGRFKRPNGDRWHFNDADIDNSELTFATKNDKLQITAEFRSLDANLKTSRVTTKGAIAVDIPEGAFKGKLTIAPEKVTGAGHVTGLVATLPATTLPLAGIPTSISGAEIKATGGFKINDDGSFTVSNATANFDIEDAQVGDKDTPFSLRMQTGTSATLTFDQLTLGIEAPRIEGRGVVEMSLGGGHLQLGNGATLEVGAGSKGKLDLAQVNWAQGQQFGDLSGALTLQAKLSGTLPTHGIVLPGGAKLTAAGSNQQNVTVNIGDFMLKPNGQFGLSKIDVKLDNVATGVVVALKDKATRSEETET